MNFPTQKPMMAMRSAEIVPLLPKYYCVTIVIDGANRTFCADDFGHLYNIWPIRHPYKIQSNRDHRDIGGERALYGIAICVALAYHMAVLDRETLATMNRNSSDIGRHHTVY